MSPLPGRPRAARLRRPLAHAVLGLAGLLTALVVLAVAGAARDDAAIDARTGRTTAEVLSVSGSRTLVRFADVEGEVHTPRQGVAHPGGLEAGQLVRVEYDLADPELVRVQGRSWTRRVDTALGWIGAAWLAAAPLAWWLRRGARPRAAAADRA